MIKKTFSLWMSECALFCLVCLAILLFSACNPLSSATPMVTAPAKASQTTPARLQPTSQVTATPVPTLTLEPLSAADILAQSALAMQQIQTMKFNYTTTAAIGDNKIVTDGQGLYQQPNQMYMKITALEQSIEMLVLNSGQVYVKMPGAEKFSLMTSNSSGQVASAPDILAQTKIQDFASQTSLAGEDTLNGVPVYVVTYTMDIPKYFKVDPANTATFDPAQTTGHGKLWISQQDFRLLQMEMDLNTLLNQNQLSLVTEMTFSDFNQPVQIPQP